jgi:tellurite resistance protein
MPQDAFVSRDIPTQPAAAEQIEQRASDMLTAGHGWQRAAGLYRRAAELRGSGDLKSADNLRIAGYLQFYDGRARAAVASLTEAGEAYLALGDVESAAETFIDAAWVAAQSEMGLEAKESSERAELLTRSPLLEAPARLALVRRLGRAGGIE